MESSVQRPVLSGETVTLIKHETADDFLALANDLRGVKKTMALGVHSTSNQPFGTNQEVFDCVVCGDRATGKHYGAISCDGCKGFFRRSVRKNPSYECQHQRNCTIDKDKRNQCRHCRWKKCIRMGMKKEAVQKERDRLGRQRNSHHSHRLSTGKSHGYLGHRFEEDEDDLSVLSLYRAEQTAKEYIGRQIELDRHPSSTERVQATLETIGISMNYQLRSLIEWAKDLKSFVELSDNDKIALLRGHTGENLVLGVACRSLNCDDYLLLGNHYVIRRTTSDAGLTRAAGRILDEIVKPLKEMQLDEKEYACLKAIVFFDNDNKSLSDPSRVRELRKRVQVNLETYISQEKPQMRGRFGDLLLLMPPLQNIARLMVDLVARYNQDTKQVDDLINEMLLNRYRDDCQDSMISTTTHGIPRITPTTSSSSPSNSISKENDFESSASSLDTDMEDSTSQCHENHSQSVMIAARTDSDDLHEVSMTVRNNTYLPTDLSHLHLLHSNTITDPNLNHHNATLITPDLHEFHQQQQQAHSKPVLPYYSQSNASIDKRSKTSVNPPLSFDPNGEMSLFYDLGSSSALIRPSTTSSLFFDTHWNGRIPLATPHHSQLVRPSKHQ